MKIAKTLYTMATFLPNRWAHRLGVGVGFLLYRFDNREKRVAKTNITRCFPELSKQAQADLVKATLKENAKTLLELPRLFKQGGQSAINLVTEVEGLSHYLDAIAGKKGVILLAPHLGNWEIAAHYLNQFATITIMYAPPKQVFLHQQLITARQSTGAVLVPADNTGVRALLKTLKKGGVVGILPDQVPSHSSAGVYAPFMQNTAFTMTLVNNLAKRSDAYVLMTFAERLGVGKGYKLHVFPAPEGIANEDATLAATALNQGMAQCVSLAPAQYQWTYKRFKHQPDGSDFYAL